MHDFVILGEEVMKLGHIQLALPQGKVEKARKFFIDTFGVDEDEKPFPLDQRGGCWCRKALSEPD